MRTVITYGTFDLLHWGHIRLLERAKALGDQLIVGVTSDQFDRARGKVNVRQSTLERVDAVRATGIADHVVIEEYEGQKIEDIKRFNVDVFTVGSDWVGKFDYLQEYCEVVYLERTEGVSSSDIRSGVRKVRMGVVGAGRYLNKIVRESAYVDGIEITSVSYFGESSAVNSQVTTELASNSFEELLDSVDAVFLISPPEYHYEQIVQALQAGVHVLCESPMVLEPSQVDKLMELASSKGLCLVETLRTVYSRAYHQLLLLVESGVVGKVKSIDATCTSLRYSDASNIQGSENGWSSISTWGPTAMLPIFQILGTGYKEKEIISEIIDRQSMYDSFTRLIFLYPDAVASATVGMGVKSEGELVVSGTKGYIYVPAPWWKMDYFEIRYEDASNNRRVFYQLDGEGIREKLVSFTKAIRGELTSVSIEPDVSRAIASVFCDYYAGTDLYLLN